MEVFLNTCGRGTVQSLLLLYLFIVKAAADCPKPQGTETSVLTDEALLMNDFPEGSQVTLECANGLVQESGSGIMSCVNNNWTEPDLICKKKDCGVPKPQPHMTFDTSAGTLFTAVIKVICDKGYWISGASYKQCYATGWSAKGAKCKIVTCAPPAEVINGKSSWDSQDVPRYGEIIQYVCNDGYTLVGRDSIKCNESGGYDPLPPSCDGVSTKAIIRPTSTPPAQDSSATPTAHRDDTVTSRATAAVSPSVRGGSDNLTAEGKATTSVTSMSSSSSSSFQDEHVEVTNKDIGYMPVIVSVICVSLVGCIVVIVLHKFLLKRKGSATGTVPIY
ncbi:complement decay-accelerating factor isoform X2 [Cottoperca gobio]|uniref:Complement decay-accelerating factor isoform X2 n=1 Tax=Cottoperca gobio TaxID=56716 RepID=A0A6J2PRT4_COTGO|nr:complement decay-accelerating factor isoform X2 [Cottoperca gobio]